MFSLQKYNAWAAKAWGIPGKHKELRISWGQDGYLQARKWSFSKGTAKCWPRKYPNFVTRPFNEKDAVLYFIYLFYCI